MREFVAGMLRDMWAYLEMRLFQRPGFLWWGAALGAGILAYALCSLYARRSGAGSGKALPVGLLVGYATLVVAVTVLSRSVGAERGQSSIQSSLSAKTPYPNSSRAVWPATTAAPKTA